MERVTGIGGHFFRTRDPKALARWYDEHLGVTLTRANYDDDPWKQRECLEVVDRFRSRGLWQEDEMKVGWEMLAGRRLCGLVGSGPGPVLRFEVKRAP